MAASTMSQIPAEPCVQMRAVHWGAEDRWPRGERGVHLASDPNLLASTCERMIPRLPLHLAA
jgi:hypothetical protein